jgi:hypothetical protein
MIEREKQRESERENEKEKERKRECDTEGARDADRERDHTGPRPTRQPPNHTDQPVHPAHPHEDSMRVESKAIDWTG